VHLGLGKGVRHALAVDPDLRELLGRRGLRLDRGLRHRVVGEDADRPHLLDGGHPRAERRQRLRPLQLDRAGAARLAEVRLLVLDDELEPAEWDKTININLRGTYLTLHFAVPQLKCAGGGSIIIMSSVNGNRTFSNAGASAYASTKAAQVALTKQLALELARNHIRVNAICPGAIHTHIDESTTLHDTKKIAMPVEFPKGNPALNEGQGEPDDIARVCLFLASDLSRHVSGVEIYVDGGMSLIR